MKVSLRPRTRITLVIAGLALFDVWTCWLWLSSRSRAESAGAQRLDCEELAGAIEGLRKAPVRVFEGARTTDAVARLVEAAAKKAALSPDRIVQIAPGDPRRIADSPYLEQSTEIELREVALKQAVELNLALAQSGPGIDIPRFTVRVPPGSEAAPEGPELWNIQMALTSRIFAPKIPAPESTDLPISQ